MKKFIAMILCLSLTLTLAACGGGPASDSGQSSNAAQAPSGDPAPTTDAGSGELTPPGSPVMVQICGATSGGTYFLISNAIAQLLNTEYSDWFRASAQSTGGTPENLRLMQDLETDFAFGQAGVALQAYKGEGDFGEPITNVASVSYMYPNVMQIATPVGSGIETLADFNGKTFCAGAPASATELNTRDMMQAAGLYANGEYTGVRIEYTSESQSSELLQNSQADGANLIAALGSAVMMELTSSGRFELYSFTREEMDAILALNDAYYEFLIPAGTYPNQEEDVLTFAVANYIYCRADLEDDLVYMFTKAMYENLDTMANAHSILSDFTIENCAVGMTVPMHPGAERYYQEVGAL